MIYYAEHSYGCGLTEAESVEEARALTVEEVGTLATVGVVREATETDISWVEGMGGWVPQAARRGGSR